MDRAAIIEDLKDWLRGNVGLRDLTPNEVLQRIDELEDWYE